MAARLAPVGHLLAGPCAVGLGKASHVQAVPGRQTAVPAAAWLAARVPLSHRVQTRWDEAHRTGAAAHHASPVGARVGGAGQPASSCGADGGVRPA